MNKNIFVVARTLTHFHYAIRDRFGLDIRFTDINSHAFTQVTSDGLVTRYIYATERSSRGRNIDGVRFLKPSPFDSSRLCDELRHRMRVSPEEFYSVKNNWYDSDSPEGKIALLGQLGT